MTGAGRVRGRGHHLSGSRYVDDIMNVAQSKSSNLKNKMLEIYRGAVEFEDTAHYRFTPDGNKRYAPWISFLDLKIVQN